MDGSLFTTVNLLRRLVAIIITTTTEKLKLVENKKTVSWAGKNTRMINIWLAVISPRLYLCWHVPLPSSLCILIHYNVIHTVIILILDTWSIEERTDGQIRFYAISICRLPVQDWLLSHIHVPVVRFGRIGWMAVGGPMWKLSVHFFLRRRL